MAISLFNLEAMAAICQLLSTPEDNLWTIRYYGRPRHTQGDGIHERHYIRSKSGWPYPADVM
jgi:hypothetical protein